MRFRPRPIPTLASLVVVGTTAALGVWQLQRSAEQRDQMAALEARWAAPPVTADELVAGGDLVYRRAEVTGVFVDAPPALVTGGLVADEPGYRWYAPLALSDAHVRLLVERGWVPATATRDELEATRPAGPVTVEGLLVPLDGVTPFPPRETDDGRLLFPLESDRVLGVLPRVIGPPLETIAAALDADDVPYALLVGPRMQAETKRSPGTPPLGGYVLPVRQTHHLSYAAQWFAIAALFLGVWVWVSLRRDQPVI